MKRPKAYTSAAAIIDEVGGTTAFAEWWGTTRWTAWHWKRNGFPAATFQTMQARLKADHKINAAPSAWNFQFAEAAE